MMSPAMRWLPVLPLALLAVAWPGAAGAATPQAVDLERGWEFRGSPDGDWKPVQGPHVFDGDAAEAGFNGKVGWYRLRFRPPRTEPGWGWDLRFEAVRR